MRNIINLIFFFYQSPCEKIINFKEKYFLMHYDCCKLEEVICKREFDNVMLEQAIYRSRVRACTTRI